VDGSDLHCTLPDIYWRERGISHQIWGRTPREILVDANWFDRGHEYVVFDESIQPVRSQRLAPGMGPMGHLIFSPDGRWLAADTYAQPDGFQRLALVDTASGALREIGRFRHQTPCAIGDMRCDLHPRWSADGRILTVDSIHAGERSIYAFETAQVTGKGAAAPSTSRGAS
jgi:hypothetical protein